jgi:hypothetical protein
LPCGISECRKILVPGDLKPAADCAIEATKVFLGKTHPTLTLEDIFLWIRREPKVRKTYRQKHP